MHPDDIPLIAKLSNRNICLSGGARGADSVWGENASKLGHQVIHWSFNGHKSYGGPDCTILLDEDVLKEADIHLEEANLTLKRTIPYGKPWIVNLLRRNWFQIKHSASVYVVGSLNEKATFSKDPYEQITARFRLGPDKKIDRMGVNGGTAWACQLYLDYFFERVPADDSCDENLEFKLIFYDQISSELFRFNPYTSAWHKIVSFPTPKGIYAAIGSRDLLPNGKAFISLTMTTPNA